ncbi:MAG: TonB-dependent receptor [Candidatus Acidiferrum sp.]
MRNLRSDFAFVLGLAFCLVFLGVFCSHSYAQSTYGTVSGIITDTTGGAIADVQVTLTNLGTSEKHAQTTGTDGLYQFTNLFPGRYRVDAEKTGFKRISHTDVVVEVQQTSRIDMTMQLGQVSQTVEVTGETPLLQPDSSSLGQVVDQRKANEIPLNGRNVYNLATLSPSVVPQGHAMNNIVGQNPFDLGNYQIGGSFANQGAEYLDGQPLNIGYINLPLVVPTQDSIAEFKVQYNNVGPEWGKFSGGIMNFSTKSGTNTWHGSAYEYLRNRVLDANEAFLKASQIESSKKNQAPPYVQNQFGGTAGGKVVKDKTFVFGSYEGYRQRAATVFQTTVPTAAERTGNFSDLCQTGFTGPGGICADKSSSGAFIHQLYDPLSVNPVTGSNQRAPIANNDLTGNYPGTTIPYINPTSAYLLKQLIASPTGSGTLNNFTKAASTGGDIDEYVARVDQNITNSQHLFGRFTYFKELSLAQDPYGTGLCKDRCAENTRSKSLAVGWTDALSQTLTASVNASISRYHYLRGPILSGFDMTKEGWPAEYNSIVPTTERTPLTPCFAVSDGSNSGNISCSQGQSAIDDHDTQWNLSPQFTKIWRRHTFSFGGQLEESYDNYLQTNTGGGLISFNGTWTAPLASNAGAVLGNDYADFLLGFGLGAGAAFGNQSTGSLVISAPIAGKQVYRALYAGDTWKLSNKLTLNLGLRYELAGPWSERFDRLTYFDQKATNGTVTGCSGTPGSSCPGDLFLVKTGVNKGRNNLPLPEDEWSPRLGAAYAFNSKTVVRAGYGIFYIPNFVSFGTNPYIDPTVSATSTFFASNNAGFYPASALNASQCTMSGTGGAANFSCAAAGPFGPNLQASAGRNPQPNVSAFGIAQTPLQPNGYTFYKPGYVEQWNIDVQRELPWGIFADVAYAGAHGVHLQQFNTNIDQIPDSRIAEAAAQYAAGQPVTIAQKVGAANYPFSLNLPGSLGPANLIQGQLDRPYPQYTGLNIQGYPCCSSRYNAFQVTVTKRFPGGGSILAAYTNAKLLSNTDTLTSWLEGSTTGGVPNAQDNYNLNNEYSLSAQDVSQRLVISYVYDLPIGHGKKFMSDATGIKDKVVNGWGFDGVTTFQRGFPLKISDSNPNLLSALSLGTGTIRPNVVAGCDKGGPRTTVEWFNTSCFVDPAPYTFGNESRVDPTLRQAGVDAWDFALFKRTYFGSDDRFNLEFRTEFFNIWNHPQFGPPNTGLGNSGFGQVTSTINSPRLIQFGLKFAF